MKCASCDFESDSPSSVWGHAGAKHVRVPKPIKHGTIAGYQMELRRGEQTCYACRRAWRLYYQRKYGVGSLAARKARKVRARKKDGGRSVLRAIRLRAYKKRYGTCMSGWKWAHNIRDARQRRREREANRGDV